MQGGRAREWYMKEVRWERRCRICFLREEYSICVNVEAVRSINRCPMLQLTMMILPSMRRDVVVIYEMILRCEEMRGNEKPVGHSAIPHRQYSSGFRKWPPDYSSLNGEWNRVAALAGTMALWVTAVGGGRMVTDFSMNINSWARFSVHYILDCWHRFWLAVRMVTITGSKSSDCNESLVLLIYPARPIRTVVAVEMHTFGISICHQFTSPASTAGVKACFGVWIRYPIDAPLPLGLDNGAWMLFGLYYFQYAILMHFRLILKPVGDSKWQSVKVYWSLEDRNHRRWWTVYFI